MNPVKVIIAVLFCGALYYYLDDKSDEQTQLQQQIVELKQQVDAKEQQIEQQQVLVETVTDQVNDNKKYNEKIDQQLDELNRVSQKLREQQAIDERNRMEAEKQREAQKKLSDRALKATYLAQGFQTMSTLKQQVVEYYMSNGRFPRNNRELKIAKPQQFASEAIRSIWVSKGGKISVVYTEKSGVDKGTISLTPKSKNQQVLWQCTTKDFVDISHHFPQCTVM